MWYSYRGTRRAVVGRHGRSRADDHGLHQGIGRVEHVRRGGYAAGIPALQTSGNRGEREARKCNVEACRNRFAILNLSMFEVRGRGGLRSTGARKPNVKASGDQFWSRCLRRAKASSRGVGHLPWTFEPLNFVVFETQQSVIDTPSGTASDGEEP